MIQRPDTPDGFACPGLTSLYPNDFNAKPEDLLDGLPLFDTLHYVIERQDKVQYTLGDLTEEMNLVYEMCLYLDDDAKLRMHELIADNPKQYLFSNMATLKFIMLALQVCNWELSRNLSLTEKRSVYKAYLFCNDAWSSEQERGIMPLVEQKNLLGMYFMADIPIIEFKTHKDFKPQLFKAGRLFDFMSKNSPYDSYLSAFLCKKGVSTWQEYVTMLFSFYSFTLDKSIVKIDEKEACYRPFFDNLCVKKDECYELWTTQNLGYLRNHPLLKMGNYYLVLNPNLLIDKLYQGLKYDIYNAIKDNKPLNKNGNPIKDFGEFSSMLGNDFSEKEIFYTVIHKTFDGIADKMISGIEMDNAKVIAPSDYYVRIGKVAFLFEYKDVTISDVVKYSCDFNRIKAEMLSRISRDDTSRKGVGQLLFSINEAVNNASLASLDPEISNVIRFHPIVVTTDKTFSSLGVQSILVESFFNMIKNYQINAFVSIPMVIDIDTLFLMSKRVHDRTIDFTSVVNEYLNLKDLKLSSFDTFYTDNYREHQEMDIDDIHYLFGDLIARVQ